MAHFWINIYSFEGSVPSDITAHEAIHHSVTFNLPNNIFNDDETDLIALLLNNDGEIVNAEKISLKSNDTSIQNVSEKPMIEYKKENNYLVVKSTQEIKKIKLISADGKMININPSINQNEVIIPVLNLSGFNILQIQFTKEFYNYKLIL